MPTSKTKKTKCCPDLENRVITMEKVVMELSEKVVELTSALNETIEELNRNGNMTHRAASRLGIES